MLNVETHLSIFTNFINQCTYHQIKEASLFRDGLKANKNIKRVKKGWVTYSDYNSLAFFAVFSKAFR